MNVHVETQTDHTARLTVEIDAEMFNQAREKAARSLSKKVNIPGFRKGKVPMRILVNYIGEAGLLEETIDQMSQDVYRQALIDSKINPYGPGSLVDVKTDVIPPSLIYTVPLQPTVDLGDYRSLRLPFEPPVVTEEQIEQAMKAAQEENALVEDGARPAVMGNRLNLALHSYFVEPGAEPVDLAAVEGDHDHEEGDAEGHGHSAVDHFMQPDQEVYIHEHAMEFTLDASQEPAPGFSEALIGVTPGETRQFVLTFPEDTDKAETEGNDEQQTLGGRSVRFIASVSKVQSLTLPVLNDDFAARITKDEEKPLTLLELRMRIRENLTASVLRRFEMEYGQKVVDALIERATLAYPEEVVQEHVESMLKEFDARLRRSGLTLDDYKKINQKDGKDLYQDWREPAERAARRSLVMLHLVELEQIQLDQTRLFREVGRFVEQFDEGIRDLVSQQVLRDNDIIDSLTNSVLQEQLFERLAAIAKGDAVPDLTPAVVEPVAEAILPELSPSDGEAEEMSAVTDNPETTVTSANEENS